MAKVAANESLWIEHLVNFFHYGRTVNGVPVTEDAKKAYVPHMEYIADDAIKNISKAGYTVRRASPAKEANFVLRVFRHECLRDAGSSNWMYGIKAYERGIADLFYDSNGNILDENIFIIQLLGRDGNSTVLQPHFVDYYLEISKVVDDSHGFYVH